MTTSVTAIFETTVVIYPSPVIRTGVESCWDTAGFEISCEGTGQDGEIRAGVPEVTPRYTDIGDGSVLDNMTGLIWLKDPNCINSNYPELSQSVGLVDWQLALDFVDGINNGTYDCGTSTVGWRLPNVRELLSLVDFSFYSYNFPPPFDYIEDGWYWSSTSQASYDSAFIVWVGGGHLNSTGKTNPNHKVIAVRGGN